MRKITTILLTLTMLVSTFTFAQVLNQNASWPNTNWIVTGTYLTAPEIFEADPTTSSNFAFDEDDAGSSATTNIAAESPVIDLTAAHTAGETWIYITAPYVYRGVTTDYVTFEYWNADTSTWVTIGDPIVQTTTSAPFDLFCSGPYETFLSTPLNIYSFSANKLSNFKYRVHYNDNGTWGWGFCFQSPTIYSATPPSCPDPSELASVSVTNNTITITWAENGSATKWNIQYGVSPTALGSGTTTPTLVNPSTITGLAANTTYDIYIQANCGGGDYSNWIGPITVTTLCDPTIAPYTETFENAGDIPNCWLQGATNNEDWIFSTYAYAQGPGTSPSGGYFAYVDDSWQDSTGTTLLSPLVDISALSSPSLAFYYNSDNGNLSNVDFSVDVFDGTTWFTDVYFSNTDTAEWQYTLIDLAPYAASGMVQVRFVVDENNGTDYQNDLTLDDVTFGEMPTCPPVMTLMASNLTPYTADISWTVLGTETSWTVEYGYEGFTPGSGTTVTTTSNPFTLENLDSATDYEYYVTVDCGSETSMASGPFPFTTACSIYPSPFHETFSHGGEIPNCWEQGTSNGEPWLFTNNTQWTNIGNGGTITGSTTSGGYMAYVDDDYPDSQGTSLTSPLVDISGLISPALIFYMVSENEGSSSVDFSVDIFDGITWHEGVYTNNTNTGGWKLVTIDLTPYYTGYPVQARFVVDEVVAWTWQDDVAIDDVMFDEMPTCIVPSYLSLDSTGIYSLDVSWVENGTATVWNLEYGPQGFTPGTGTTIQVYTNPATIEGLLDGTEYDIYVQADCDTSTSLWTGPLTATTSCLPFGNFVENFDSYSYGEIPDCWTGIDATGSQYSYVEIETWNYNSASNAISMYNYNATSGDLMLVTPMLTDLPAGTHRAKFFAMGSSWSTYAIEVGTLTDITDPSTFTPVTTINLTGSFEQYIVDFNTPTTAPYVAIRHAMTGSYQTIYIDDFVWTAIPTAAAACATNVAATPDATCGNYDNTLSWDLGEDADGYYLTIGTTSGGNDVLDNEDIGFTSSYTFPGEMDTTYYYTLTPYNSVGSATGCPEMSFTTVSTGCYCESVPLSVDGNGISNVTIGSSSFSNSSASYSDYTGGTPITVASGISTSFSIVFETGFSYDTNIWIDFNDNFNFEPSEQVYDGASDWNNPTTLEGSFIIPASAALGQHVMRIGTADSGQYDPEPCYNGYWGVTIDMMLDVVTATCTPATIASTEAVFDCTGGTFSVDVDITALGDGTPSITDGTSTWPVTAVGVTNVGPFSFGSPVSLTLLHGVDNTCDLPISTFNYAGCPPANDECANAITLTVGNTYSAYAQDGNLTAATSSGYTNTCAGAVSLDIWYSVVVPADGNVTIQTGPDLANTTTSYDTGLEVYSGVCGSLSSVGCNDDGAGNLYSVVSLTGQTPGSTLYVRVWEYGGDNIAPFSVSAYNTALKAESFDNFSFTYYPNPVNNNKLNLSSEQEISNVNVFNVLGQQVLKLTPNAANYEVDMSQLTSGTYFVEVVSDSKSKTIKIIKE